MSKEQKYWVADAIETIEYIKCEVIAGRGIYPGNKLIEDVLQSIWFSEE